MKHTLKYGVLGVLLGLQAVALPAFADDAEDLKTVEIAFQKNDFMTAFKLLKPLAEKGNAEAQHHLGVMYANGEGVKQDYAAAVKWYKLAADQGIAVAQYNLGVMYTNGLGIKQDYVEAIKWLTLADKQYADFQVRGLAGDLRTMLSAMVLEKEKENQIAVQEAYRLFRLRDYTNALKIFRPLAERGNAYAQHRLGLMCFLASGIEKNDVEALKWFKLAAAQNLAEGQYGVGFMYEKGAGVKQDYNEAVKWYKQAAAQGYADALYSLAEMYYEGSKIKQNYAEAVKWYKLVAGQGNAGAQLRLGSMYYKGQGVKQDYAEAVKWYKLAAAQNYNIDDKQSAQRALDELVAKGIR